MEKKYKFQRTWRKKAKEVEVSIITEKLKGRKRGIYNMITHEHLRSGFLGIMKVGSQVKGIPTNAAVKLFCPHPLIGQPRGKRKNVCHKKGQGT